MNNSIESAEPSQFSFHSILEMIRLNINSSPLDLISPESFPSSSQINSYSTFQSYLSEATKGSCATDSVFLAYYVRFVFELFSKEPSSAEILIESSLHEMLSLKSDYSLPSLFTIAEITLLFGFVNPKSIKACKLKGERVMTEYFITQSVAFVISLVKEQNKHIENDEKPFLSFLTLLFDLVRANDQNKIVLSKRTTCYIALMQTFINCTYSIEMIMKMKQFMFALFEWRLPKQLMLHFFNNFPRIMINYNKKADRLLINDLHYAQSELELLAHIISQEAQLTRADPFHLRKFFLFSNSNKSGMTFLYPHAKSSQSSIIFSFKWLPLPNEATYCLLSLTTKSMSYNLSFAIDKAELVIFALNARISTNIKVEPNKTYLLIISLTSLGKKGNIWIQYNNSPKYTFAIEAKPLKDEEVRCHLGYLPSTLKGQYHFNGGIGTLVLTSDVVTEQEAISVFSFKGFYDIIPYLANHSVKKLFLFENLNSYKTSNFITADSFFKENKAIIAKYNCVIDPKHFNREYLLNDKDRVSYRLSKANVKNGDAISIQIDLLAPFSAHFDVIDLNSSLAEFLMNDGVKHLTLHLIYYSHLLRSLKNGREYNEELFVKIYDNIQKLIDFSFHIVISVRVSPIKAELNDLFVEIREVIEQIRQFPKKTIGKTLFASLFKSCSTSESVNEQFRTKKDKYFLLEAKYDFFPFLLTSSLYSIDDTETLIFLFKLSKWVLQEEKTAFFCSPLIMKRLMSFGEVFALSKKSEQRNQFKLLLQVFFIYPIEKMQVDYLMIDPTPIYDIYFYELQQYIKPETPMVLYSFLNAILQTEANLNSYLAFFLLVIEKFINIREEEIEAFSPLKLKTIYLSLFALLDIQCYHGNKLYRKELKTLIERIIMKVVSMYDSLSVIMKMLLVNALGKITRKERMKLFSIKRLQEWPKQRVINQNASSTIPILKHSIALILKTKGKDTQENKSILLSLINDILVQCPPENAVYEKLFGYRKTSLMLTLISDDSLFNEEELITLGKDYFKLLTTHKESFWFQLMMTKAQSKKSTEFLTELLHLMLLDILMKEDKMESNIFFAYNLANLLVTMHYMIKSPCKEVFNNNQIKAILYGFFGALDKSNMMYTKAFFLNQSKILAEQYFEFHIELYLLTHSITNFEFIHQKWLKKVGSKVYSVPFLLEDKKQISQFLTSNALNTIRGIEKEIEKAYGKVPPYNYPYVFLLKCFWFLIDNQTDDMLKGILDNIALTLCKEIHQLYASKMITVEKQEDNKSLYYYIKSQFELNYNVNKDYQAFKVIVFTYLYSKNSSKNSFGNPDSNMDHLAASLSKHIEEKGEPTALINCFEKIQCAILSDPLDAIAELTKEDVFKTLNKKKWLLSNFGLFFKEFYFNSELFIKMKNEFVTKDDVIKETKLLNYPSIRKHFYNGVSPPLFLKQNMNFFTSQHFQISHAFYLKEFKAEDIDTLPFFKTRITLNRAKSVRLGQDILLNKINAKQHCYYTYCELISPNYCLFGTLTFTLNYLIFQNEEKGIDDTDLTYVFSSLKEDRLLKEKQVLISYLNIKEVLIRRYILMWQAIEIFLKNGKSYFLNLFNESNVKPLLTVFTQLLPNSSLIIDNSLNEFNSKHYTDRWRKSQMTNYDFLNVLNKYSSRTFRDLNQYYVFPWLLNSYTEDEEEAEMKYRDLSRAISVQTEEQMKLLKEKYADVLENKFELPISTHYSTSAFILYYLVRSSPFNELLINLQNMQFDDVNRAFISLNSTLSTLNANKDPRELLPEFYSQAEFMINLNCVDYGIKQNKHRLDDVLLNNSASQKEFSSFVDWVITQRKLLNSLNLGPWIDAIFGVNQHCSLLSKNPFCFYSDYSFEQFSELDALLKAGIKQEKKPAEIIKKIKDNTNIIINFGQCPHQLLHSSVSAYKRKIRDAIVVDNDDDYLNNLIEDINQYTEERNEIICFWENTNQTISLVTRKREVLNYSLSGFSKISCVKCKKFKLLNKVVYHTQEETPNQSKAKDLAPKGKGGRNTFNIFEAKYAVIGLYDGSMIISCRYPDNSIKINYVKEQESNEILLEAFVTCLCKRELPNCSMLYSGLSNGKLIEWTSDLKKKKTKATRSLIAHTASIDVICISEQIGVILTAGRDHFIYIRKLFDFELLTVIPIGKSLLVVDLQFSPSNFLYAKCFDCIRNKFCIKGFTMTGINFITSRYDLYNSINFTLSGNVVVGYYDRLQVTVLKGGNLSEVRTFEVNLDRGKAVTCIKFKKKKQLLYLGLNEGFTKKKLFD